MMNWQLIQERTLPLPIVYPSHNPKRDKVLKKRRRDKPVTQIELDALSLSLSQVIFSDVPLLSLARESKTKFERLRSTDPGNNLFVPYSIHYQDQQWAYASHFVCYLKSH